jgi:two-component system chemotaxis response regulator CheY
MRILLVDDSNTMRALQKTVLAQLGYQDVAEATGAQDALDTIETFKPDFVLVGSNLPSMDGLAFVRAYRLRDKSTPIMMVTTEAEKSRVLDAIRAGVNNYVVKPFTPDLLARRITETLAKCRTHAG